MTAEETKKRHHDVIVNLEATYREIDQKTRRCVPPTSATVCDRTDSGARSTFSLRSTRLLFSTMLDAP